MCGVSVASETPTGKQSNLDFVVCEFNELFHFEVIHLSIALLCVRTISVSLFPLVQKKLSFYAKRKSILFSDQKTCAP